MNPVGLDLRYLQNPALWTPSSSLFLLQVVLIHSRIGLADEQLVQSVRQQAKEVLLEKGVELVLGMLAASH